MGSCGYAKYINIRCKKNPQYVYQEIYCFALLYSVDHFNLLIL